MVIELPENRTRGTRYPDEVKQLAYEVYSKRCDGDMPDTLAILAELIDPPLSEKTVYEWRTAYGWIERHQEEKRAIAPYSWDLYFGGLSVAAPESVTYLRSVIADEAASPRDRIAASRAILSQVAAHFAELERRNQPTATPVSLDGLSTEELMAMASSGGAE